MVKDKPHTTSPDSPEATINDIPCDQCNHPKSFHRQKKYYCLAEVMYNDPINANEPIKAMCSCTNFANAEDETKKKKEKEDKEKEKEKDKEKQKPIDNPEPKDQKQGKQESKPLAVQQQPAIKHQGGILI